MVKWVWLFIFLGMAACVGKVDDVSDFDDDADDITQSLLSKGAWAGQTTLTVGNINNSLKVTADFKSQGAKPGTYTILLNSTQPPNGCTPVAVITWSVAGNSVTREVSLGNGVSVTGTGEGFTVTITDATDTTHYGFFTPPAGPGQGDYVVTALVTKGTRGSDGQPPTFIPGAVGNALVDVGPGTYNVVAGGAVVIPIPQNVGVKSVFVSAIDVNATPNVVTTADGFISQQNGVAVYGNFYPNTNTWVPIIPGARTLELFNTLAGGGHTLAFYVAFGIDG